MPPLCHITHHCYCCTVTQFESNTENTYEPLHKIPDTRRGRIIFQSNFFQRILRNISTLTRIDNKKYHFGWLRGFQTLFWQKCWTSIVNLFQGKDKGVGFQGIQSHSFIPTSEAEVIHFGHNCYFSYLLLISKSQMTLAVPAWDHEGLLLNVHTLCNT